MTISDELYVEIEKAKEVMRAAAHLYRSSSYGNPAERAVQAVRDAELVAGEAFRKVDALLAKANTTK